jgi:hypothetical protein
LGERSSLAASSAHIPKPRLPLPFTPAWQRPRSRHLEPQATTPPGRPHLPPRPQHQRQRARSLSWAPAGSQSASRSTVHLSILGGREKQNLTILIKQRTYQPLLPANRSCGLALELMALTLGRPPIYRRRPNPLAHTRNYRAYRAYRAHYSPGRPPPASKRRGSRGPAISKQAGAGMNAKI